jgi:hypothetical protein
MRHPLISAMRMLTIGVRCTTSCAEARTSESTDAAWSSCTSKKIRFAADADAPTRNCRRRFV